MSQIWGHVSNFRLGLIICSEKTYLMRQMGAKTSWMKLGIKMSPWKAQLCLLYTLPRVINNLGHLLIRQLKDSLTLLELQLYRNLRFPLRKIKLVPKDILQEEVLRWATSPIYELEFNWFKNNLTIISKSRLSKRVLKNTTSWTNMRRSSMRSRKNMTAKCKEKLTIELNHLSAWSGSTLVTTRNRDRKNLEKRLKISRLRMKQKLQKSCNKRWRLSLHKNFSMLMGDACTGIWWIIRTNLASLRRLTLNVGSTQSFCEQK